MGRLFNLLNIGAALALLALAGCDRSTPPASAEAQLAEEMREGCVATNLEALRLVVARAQPLLAARSYAEFEERVRRDGGAIDPADPYRAVYLTAMLLTVDVTFTEAGEAVDDPARADGLRVEAWVEDARRVTIARLEFTGPVVGGTLTTDEDGCRAMTRASGLPMALDAGALDLAVTPAGADPLGGIVTLLGDTALIELEFPDGTVAGELTR